MCFIQGAAQGLRCVAIQEIFIQEIFTSSELGVGYSGDIHPEAQEMFIQEKSSESSTFIQEILILGESCALRYNLNSCSDVGSTKSCAERASQESLTLTVKTHARITRAQ